MLLTMEVSVTTRLEWQNEPRQNWGTAKHRGEHLGTAAAQWRWGSGPGLGMAQGRLRARRCVRRIKGGARIKEMGMIEMAKRELFLHLD